MQATGKLLKLSHKHNSPIDYFMQLDKEEIHINPYLGKKLKFKFLGEIHCIECGRKIKKTYNNGFCYPCFKKLPQNDLCFVKPSLCHYDKGTCRDDTFGEEYCMTPHIVYLALSSDVKVGITRKASPVKRWIDQGAIQAIILGELPSRKEAGELEHYLSKYLPDKTNWRKMLKGEISSKSVIKVKKEIIANIPEQYIKYLVDTDQIEEFEYPLEETEKNVKSVTLDKQEEIVGRLIGIKGQYLLLDTGVFNIRKHSGYKVSVEII